MRSLSPSSSPFTPATQAIIHVTDTSITGDPSPFPELLMYIQRGRYKLRSSLRLFKNVFVALL